jgi:hypothetical protein
MAKLSFGLKLKRLRGKRGLTQNALAKSRTPFNNNRKDGSRDERKS